MYTKYLLAGAAAAVAVAAQSSTSTAPIAFTSIPARVTAGSDVTIYWGGGDMNVSVLAGNHVAAHAEQTISDTLANRPPSPSS